MTHFSERYLKTGADPRTLPDYAALRDELSKLAHPARPDVNWHYAEKLCLALFGHNGVELQTAAWYTLCRTQLAGLFGLNEGLAILDALISHQWSGLWPQPVHARMEILSSLSQRIQHLELKHLCQFDPLRTLMHNSAVRLENSDVASGHTADNQPGFKLSIDATPKAAISVGGLSGIPGSAKSESPNTVKWVCVAQPAYQPNVGVVTEMPSSTKPWKPFATGMVTMLVISATTVWGWNAFHRPDPLQTQLAASLAPLPSVLSSEQLEGLRQQAPLPETIIKNTRQQLARLEQLPPGWTSQYGHQLVQQALMMWPEQAKGLAREWQQQLNAAALPTENLNGWHEGMSQLQQLSHKLNGLDGQKGKYMTVSELKSVVYSATQAFNRSIPAEEQLRRYAVNPSDIQRRQVETVLQQLQKRYALFRLGQQKETTILATE
ncbi:VasL domain-containing protein [Erwinia amylovora]|uniref:VasL domain-containing protein n=1 Tax=Erwinia amylovora TaxID=552 RepID=UPI001443EEF3|nr:VasL domain-containing protein [Erwinia amylovora]